MSKRVFNLADKLVAKYAKEEEIPETLRSGLTNLPPPPAQYISPQVEETPGPRDITPSKLDTGSREHTRIDIKKMLDILDIMLHTNIITPTYYEGATRFLHKGPANLSGIHRDFVQIAERAQNEVNIYQKRLNVVKALLGK